MIDIKVPTVGESISEVTLLKWLKKSGDYVERDEVIAELESEKATFEVNAEQAGVISLAAISEGDTIKIGDQLASIDETAVKPAANAATKAEQPADKKAPAAQPQPEKVVTSTAPVTSVPNDIKASPVASAIIADKKVDPKTVTATGPAGKILKDDVLAALSNPGKQPFKGAAINSRNTRNEKMSNLRKTISRRLVEAKNTTAMLTTFNEVDMGRIMEIRTKYKDKFKEAHGVGLGFMSFFAKACAIALSEWPTVNAFIDGENIVYHDYADISIAVSTPRGLTVPVIRNVESLSMAEVEKKVIELAGKARDSKLTTEELTGGTFTITNGGVFGSLMSTPIINIP
ncbi:MAG TPA: dihydrolipoyllysine-residue succinyltransferase, partial [Chitinophagaceae bacterium]|nr:dihydrolipoyllysine-residue succinyltransferase [Chitinophagaceae bacterium]